MWRRGINTLTGRATSALNNRTQRSSASTAFRLTHSSSSSSSLSRYSFSSMSSSTISAPTSSTSVSSSTTDSESASGSELQTLATPTALQSISYFASSLDFERLDVGMVHHTARYLADTLACALAAVKQRDCLMIRSYVRKHTSSERGAILFGERATAAPGYAALLNSALIRCLDANDLSIPFLPGGIQGGTHASDALGGVFALCDPEQNTGQQLLMSVLIAYEVQFALGSTFSFLDRGFHSLSQVNFAVPAAAAVFPQFKLTPSALTHAMALSSTTGLTCNTWLKQGKTANVSAASSASSSSAAAAPAKKQDENVPSVKFASVGLASQRSIDALELVQIGITANIDTFETMMAFFNGDRPLFLDHFNNLGKKLTMDRHLIKQFPAQFNLQAPINCAIELYEKGVRFDQIESIHVEGHIYTCSGVQGCAAAFVPSSQGSADHSTPYVIVSAIMKDGQFTPDSAYGYEDWLRADVREVMSRVKLTVTDEFEGVRLKTGALGCRVTAVTKDGKTIVAHRTTTTGHPDNPMSDADLKKKMRALLAPNYGEEMGDKLWQACMNLVESEDTEATKHLFDLITTPPK